MDDAKALQINIDAYAWESEAQKEGYLNYVQYCRQRGWALGTCVDLTVAYFIQKDIDSNDYWRELVGNQIRSLEDQIRGCQEEMGRQFQSLETLGLALKNNTMLVEQLIAKLPGPKSVM